MLDLIIVGAGPAGLSAAIYAARAELNFIVLEKAPSSGGQIVDTYEVDNYPGLYGVSGYDLATAFRTQADQMGARFVTDEVIKVTKEGEIFTVTGKKDSYQAAAVIAAAGERHRSLGVPGEKELTGHGVSFCATCDGAFFRKKDVAVVGGGDVAVEDAIFLSKLCKKVYLIHRRDQLRAAKSLQSTVFSLPNVCPVYNAVVTAVCGKDRVNGVKIRSVADQTEREIPLEGVFLAVGTEPLSDPFSDLADCDKGGYLLAGEDCVTKTPGLFAAGDIRTTMLRQVVTAAADGARAATQADRYLSSLKRND